MNAKQIKLSNDEFWPLLNVLNEVTHGFRIDNFLWTLLFSLALSVVNSILDNLAKE